MTHTIYYEQQIGYVGEWERWRFSRQNAIEEGVKAILDSGESPMVTVYSPRDHNPISFRVTRSETTCICWKEERGICYEEECSVCAELDGEEHCPFCPCCSLGEQTNGC